MHSSNYVVYNYISMQNSDIVLLLLLNAGCLLTVAFENKMFNFMKQK